MPAGFWISPSNPNAEQGGGDLITPTHQTVDVKGPWVVFPNVDCAEAQGQLNLPHAALPLSALHAILAEAGGVEPDYTAGEGDIRDKIAKPTPADTAWEDLPVETQNALLTQFPRGGPTRTPFGIVDVPDQDNAEPYAPPAPLAENGESALAELAAELPTETPDETGGYSPVEDVEETPVI